MIRLLFDVPRIIARYFRLFRAQTGNGVFLLMALSVVMSYAEGIGIALFFPLFMHGQPGNDALSTSLTSVFRFLGIPATPLGALPFIVGMFLLKGVLQFGTYAYQAWLCSQIPRTLRRRIIDGLRGMDYRAIFGTNTGYYSNLIVSEVNRFDSAFLHFVRTLPPALNVMVFFAIVFWLDWRVTALCALMGLVVVAVIRLSGRLAQHYSNVNAQENAKLNSLLIQMIQAFKYLRATAGFGAFQRRISVSSDALQHAEYRLGAAGGFSTAVPQPLMVLFLSAVLYYRAGVQGKELGSLFVLLMYFFRIMGDLWGAQYSWQCFCGYLGSVDMVQAALDKLHLQAEPRGSAPYAGLTRAISIQNVTFNYTPERPVLQNIDLEIAKNVTVAFVGESGSGKSTLVDLITGTLKPTTGDIAIDGTSLTAIDLESLRQHIGYVPQDAMLFDDTVANNIALWTAATEAQIRDAAERAKCLEFIDAMPEKLASQIGDRGVMLSGGQRQRLAIARELLKRPDILVLDEATSALDSESEHAIQQSIDSLKGQMTILIIAHRLSTIRNCDRVMVLHEGRIVESGSYSELLAKPGSRFRRMCELQKLTEDTEPAISTGT